MLKESDVNIKIFANRFTMAELEMRLDFVENQIRNCRDEKSLPYLNKLFQELISALAEKDLRGEKDA